VPEKGPGKAGESRRDTDTTTFTRATRRHRPRIACNALVAKTVLRWITTAPAATHKERLDLERADLEPGHLERQDLERADHRSRRVNGPMLSAA